MFKKLIFWFIFILPALLVVSCTSSSPTPSEQGNTAYVPPDTATCSELANILAQATGVDVTTGEAAFDDIMSGESGSGCQATADGTGVDFASPLDVVTAVNLALSDQGWSEDPSYAAGGPTGMADAFRQDDDLCLLSVNWEPSEDANCPTDQPIAACDLSPEQQLYTLELNCAMSTLPSGE